MKVKIKLFLSDQLKTPMHETYIDIPEDKLELLNEEELNAALEINVRTWAEQNLLIDWEVDSE